MPISLPVGTDTLQFLIDKAHEFQAKEDVVIPETPLSPSEDWALQILANHKDDHCYQEFCNAVNELEPDQQLALVALMWVGRGDYSKEEWAEALRDAAEQHTISTAQYLITTPLVADFLQEGMAEFGLSCDEE